MKTRIKREVPKLRSYRHIIAGEVESGYEVTYICCYRPVWTQQGLKAHLTFVNSSPIDSYFQEVPLGEINLFSLREREVVARTLEALVGHSGEDSASPANWHYILATFFGEIIEGERAGRSPVRLSDVALPEQDLSIDVDGWSLLTQHATILFGDGESAKSYLALWLAGRLTQLGKRVLYCDWELSAGDHRVRLGKLFPDDMPDVHYLACNAPITELVEDIQSYAVKERIDYLICDSAAFACSGPAETSEAATGYFAAVRDIGVSGSLHIAHTTKRTIARDRGSEKPFGSAFWHNSARATWMLSGKKSADKTQIEAKLEARKNNLMQRGADLAVRVTFDGDSTVVELQAADAADMTTEQKILAFVRGHPESSKNTIYKHVGGNRQEVLQLIDALVTGKHCDKGAGGKISLGPKAAAS